PTRPSSARPPPGRPTHRTTAASLLLASRPSFSFFFIRARRPRALHSFPTRRSSDLPWPPRYVASPVSTSPTPHPSWNVSNLGGGDRKSTRLNSSHVSISYAVFCLKKKRERNMAIQLRQEP